MRKQPRATLEYFIVFLIAVVPFLPSVFFGLTNWDDNVYVTDNPLIKVSTPETWKAILTETFANFYHPLTLVSLKLDHLLFKGMAEGSHAVNVFLHGLVVVLFFHLCRRWLGTRRVSVGITLLFALHPLRAEVVYWVTERKELLCAVFSLLALCSYHPASKRVGFPFGAFFFFVCALLSKSMAVSLPLVFLLVDGWECSGGSAKKMLIEKSTTAIAPPYPMR